VEKLRGLNLMKWRWSMRVGDLVKERCPATPHVGKVYVVVDVDEIEGVVGWIRILPQTDAMPGSKGWTCAKDHEVISESKK